jgi:hypothetical protein
MLAAAIPAQATFYLQFIIIAAFGTFSISLLNPAGLVMGALQRRKESSVEQEEGITTASLAHGAALTRDLFIVLLAFVFMIPAPALLYFACLYFAIAFVVRR